MSAEPLLQPPSPRRKPGGVFRRVRSQRRTLREAQESRNRQVADTATEVAEQQFTDEDTRTQADNVRSLHRGRRRTPEERARQERIRRANADMLQRREAAIRGEFDIPSPDTFTRITAERPNTEQQVARSREAARTREHVLQMQEAALQRQKQERMAGTIRKNIDDFTAAIHNGDKKQTIFIAKMINKDVYKQYLLQDKETLNKLMNLYYNKQTRDTVVPILPEQLTALLAQKNELEETLGIQKKKGVWNRVKSFFGRGRIGMDKRVEATGQLTQINNQIERLTS